MGEDERMDGSGLKLAFKRGERLPPGGQKLHRIAMTIAETVASNVPPSP